MTSVVSRFNQASILLTLGQTLVATLVVIVVVTNIASNYVTVNEWLCGLLHSHVLQLMSY